MLEIDNLGNRESGKIKQEHVVYGTVSREMSSLVRYIFPKLNFSKSFRARISSRRKWAANFFYRNCAISLAMEG